MANDTLGTVIGVFEDQNMARRAVDDLKSAGFNDDQIGFAVRNGKDGEQVSDSASQDAGNVGGGAATGAIGGGVLGGIIGAAASLLIPGFGPVIAGGILAATLGGAALGAAAGGILGALTGMGVPEEEARYYQGEFEAGRTIVTVKAGDREQEAVGILRRNGAYDAGTRNQAAGVLNNEVTPGSRTYESDQTTTTGAGYSPAFSERSSQVTSNNFNQNNQYAGGSWETVSPRYRTMWQQQYGNQGGRWEDFEPVYRYGWEMRSNPQYSNLSWADAEPRLRKDWESRYPNRPWNQASSTLQQTWDTGYNDFGGQDFNTEESRAVPIREEQLQANKERVQTGEVRIGKEIVTEEKTINVPVQREEVVIERRNFAPQDADAEIGADSETIRVPVSEEQVNVEKRPVVTGEVRVGKQTFQENQQVSDTIRREEPRLEREGDINVRGNQGDQFETENPS